MSASGEIEVLIKNFYLNEIPNVQILDLIVSEDELQNIQLAH